MSSGPVAAIVLTRGGGWWLPARSNVGRKPDEPSRRPSSMPGVSANHVRNIGLLGLAVVTTLLVGCGPAGSGAAGQVTGITVPASSCAPVADPEGGNYNRPSLKATPLPGVPLCLPDKGIDEVFAENGILTFAPPGNTVPAVSQAAAETTALSDPGQAPHVHVKSATLVVFQYAELGRPAVLAWVVDLGFPGPIYGNNGFGSGFGPTPSGTPLPSPTVNTGVYDVDVVDAQAGDARTGKIIWGAVG
jgi:hypothetical protein